MSPVFNIIKINLTIGFFFLNTVTPLILHILTAVITIIFTREEVPFLNFIYIHYSLILGLSYRHLRILQLNLEEKNHITNTC